MTYIAQISDDGTTTVGGVKCKLVPIEPEEQILRAIADAKDRAAQNGYALSVYDLWVAATTANPINFSSLPVMPERKDDTLERFAVDEIAAYSDGWNACRDAILKGGE